MINKDRVIRLINERLAVHPLEKQISEHEHEAPTIHALVDAIIVTIEHEVNNLRQLIEFKCRQRVCPKCGEEQ